MGEFSKAKQETLWDTDPYTLLIWESTHSRGGEYRIMRTAFGFVLTTWRFEVGCSDWIPFATTYIPGEQ
jgi:hypothetical protein